VILVGWYLRRAIPWVALLGCCAAAMLLGVALAQWPTSALVLLPAMVATCAAAAAFCFDEVSLPVVEVTPRGATWRRTARLTAAAVPLGAWTLFVAGGSGDVPLDRSAWWVVGGAAIVLTLGTAALASRNAVASPGGSLASAVVLLVISPVVISAFLGWDSLYPIGEFGAGVLTFWLVVAGTGVVAAWAALRPGVGA